MTMAKDKQKLAREREIVKGGVGRLYQAREKVQSLWKTVWWFLKMLNIELPRDPESPFLDLHLTEMNTYVHTNHGT